MRRNSKANSRENKEVAKFKYAERQIDKWVKWSISIKGKVKYKDLIKQQNKYGIICQKWSRTGNSN